MTELNPPQKEVIERGLLSTGFSVVLQMPTGAEKTWLAEQAIGVTLRAGHRAVYLTPLRALANELVERWRKTFEAFDVGVFTGEYGQRQAYPVPFYRARLLIMTPERLDACTRHWRSHWSWLPEVSLLVVDELHLLGEPRRGAQLEGALLRARRLNPFMQVVGLSATLGNRTELADWLGGVEFSTTWRPIPIEWRVARYKKATDKPRLLVDEVMRCVDAGGQTLVFVQSRRRAESLSATLREAGVPAGHHHAGLDDGERRQLEREYRSGALRALVSTGTLEMGLNLPARQVVLYDLQHFDGQDFVPLSANTVWQRAGRAGRRGLDPRGEVVLCAAAWDRAPERYSGGQFERIASGLSDSRALAEQLLAEVASGLARTRAQLVRNFACSLAAHQERLLNVEQVLETMLEGGMLVELQEDEARTSALKTTRLGRIAVRQMLSPSTVLTLARALRGDGADDLTFFDVLLLCAASDDCEPRIPVDFEELEELASLLAKERSTFLEGGSETAIARLGGAARRFLTVVKTALVIRAWTREGDAARVAEEFGCYAFEVRRLT
jgi:helicase